MGHCLFLRKGEVHTAPVTGVLASSLAVGSTVKLMEGGTAVEYLVVNQGIPSNSSLYDASCNGTWLLRKDIHSKRPWNSSNVNTYASSTINTWLNGDFFNSLGEIERVAVKQVKIPYFVGNGNKTIKSGANGLGVKAFLLGGYETGWTTSDLNAFPIDGSVIDFFKGTAKVDTKRIANSEGTAVSWHLRSAYVASNTNIFIVSNSGGFMNSTATRSDGIRPAVILPGNALFDKTTMLLKGVK